MSGTGTRRAFREAIEDALALLEAPARPPRVAAGEAVSLPSLLDQCQAMIREAAAQDPAPLRSLHHLACSGGTLIARCIAALPNVRLLSEVEPLSEMPLETRRFFPNDLINLARQGSRPPGQEVLAGVFLGGLRALHEDSRRHGLHLVLRDHAHSLFTYGPEIAPRPTLRELLAREHGLRSVVTVRHPLDCYLALQANHWIKFSPPTLEEYCRRSLAFLDRHAELERLRYEDFVAEPQAAMQHLCAVLELPYDPAFLHLFAGVRLSGDSGRQGALIRPRGRRSCPEAVREQALTSAAYVRLCTVLGYDPAPDALEPGA